MRRTEELNEQVVFSPTDYCIVMCGVAKVDKMWVKV